MITLRATTEAHGDVHVDVVDLTEFVHAGPDDQVCVAVAPEGDQTFVAKRELRELEPVE
jgi:hypothetical protein